MLLRAKHTKYSVYGNFAILFIQCCFFSAQENVATLNTRILRGVLRCYLYGHDNSLRRDAARFFGHVPLFLINDSVYTCSICYTCYISRPFSALLDNPILYVEVLV